MSRGCGAALGELAQRSVACPRRGTGGIGQSAELDKAISPFMDGDASALRRLYLTATFCAEKVVDS